MSELLDRARELKPELDRAEAARQEELRLENERIEAERNMSNEHAAEFVKLMEDNNIPTVELYLQSSDHGDNASLVGEGWIIYPPTESSSGITLLNDLRVFHYQKVEDDKLFTVSRKNLQDLAMFASHNGVEYLVTAIARSGIV